MASEHVKKLSAGNLDFGLALYRLVDKKDNVFFSATSIQLCLGMVRAGAKNKTLEQMTKGLQLHHLDKEDDANLAFSAIIDTLNNQNRELTLKTANKIYVQQSYQLLKEFIDTLTKHFKSETGIVDFATASGKACEEINNWVSGVTNAKIKQIVMPALISPGTKLVLVNAVYFKGTWKDQFEESNTKPLDFNVDSFQKIKVEMMSQKEDFRYVESADLDCKVISLPYSMSSLCMLILLPNKVDGLDALIPKLNAGAINKLNEGMVKEKVTLKLPKFKIETSYNLNDALSSMGMAHMFSDGEADFSGMTGTRDLSVSAVIHKTFLDVNEKGVEAAAVTAAIMMECAAFFQAPRPEKEFIADHPFAFLIMDRQTGLSLFMGGLRNPAAK